MYSITALLLCVADPSWSFSLGALYLALGPISLHALHLAYGLHHFTDSRVSIMFICVFVCANVILYTYLLGHLALLDLMVSLMPTFSKEGVRSGC